MGRQKGFDQEKVIESATALFKSKGYEKTSIQDLCEATGLNRGSIYDTFGDKKEFFLICLDRLRFNFGDPSFFILKESGATKDIMERFFMSVIDIAMNDERRQGCLMVNTAAENAAFDVNIASRVEAFSLDMENLFYNFLMKAQKNGSLKSKLNIRELARFFVNTRQGLYVMSKTATDRKVLLDVAKVAVSVLV